MSKRKPREMTEAEVRKQFLEYIHVLVTYWGNLPHKTTNERLEGLAFSILVAIDGEAAEVPGFTLSPRSLPEDKEYLRGEGRNWYPDNCDIGGPLHEEFYNPK